MPDKEFSPEEVKAALAQLNEITPALQQAAKAQEPSPEAAAAAAASAAAIPASYGDIVKLRKDFLVNYSDQELMRCIGEQMVAGSKDGQGVPFDTWAGESAKAAALGHPMLQKLIDVAGGSALIRQDLEPMLYAAFVRRFPLYDRLSKEPSNGLVHAYNRTDAPPTASFIAELGAVPTSQSVYTRATTNIAIIAVEVGVGFKAQFAVAQGGAGYNPEVEEVRNGVLAIAKKMQLAIFSGNDSVPGKVGTDPEGAYDANGFDGLRKIVPAANIQAIGTDTILEALNTADGGLGVFGGRTSIVCMDGRDRVTLMNELQPHVRFVNRLDVVPGLPQVEAVALGNSGEVPVLAIPGNEIGGYTVGNDTVRDLYLLDETVLGLPWLGSESPTILEIPPGVDSKLSRRYILFLMSGLKVAVPNFIAKVRLVQ